MQSRRTLTIAAALALTLTACASPAPAPETRPHGYVEGATEAAEPQLHLAALSASGDVTLLDLLDESTTDLGAVDLLATHVWYPM